MEEKFLKITNAIYGILDFLPDTDPLKNKAKEKVLRILENLALVSGAEGWVSLKKEKASAELLDDIEILLHYLDVGKNQGWIDAMNFLIITKEYRSLKAGIKVPRGVIRQSLEITESARNNEPLISLAPERLNNQLMIMEAPAANETPADGRNKNHSKNQSLLSPKALARQGKILKILNEREKTQVSDLIRELPNITKRTVRRDLDDLLKQGKIKRAGEWNQVFYTLNRETFSGKKSPKFVLS